MECRNAGRYGRGNEDCSDVTITVRVAVRQSLNLHSLLALLQRNPRVSGTQMRPICGSPAKAERLLLFHAI
jgi:hypothetical protein